MNLLIDGYNLLNDAAIVDESPGAYRLEHAREAVVRVLRGLLSQEQYQETTIVFDGREAPPGLPAQIEILGMDVRFSRRGEEADDLLEELIEQHDAPRNLTVVSSDHRVQRAARRRRATAIDSKLWIDQQRTAPRHVPTPPEKPASPLCPEELAAWVKRFSDPE